MRLSAVRWAPRLAPFFCLLLLGGCADMLPFAGFGGSFALGPFRHYVQNLPVQRVVAQVECELREFLNKKQDKNWQNENKNEGLFLDPRQSASISLNLQTDESGGVTYTGIDLGKIGLTSLGELISINNKIPSLQARLQIKGTVSAQLDLAVPQTFKDLEVEDKETDSKWRLIDPKAEQERQRRLRAKTKEQWKKERTIVGLWNAPQCAEGFKAILAYPDRLFLTEWLNNFFKGYDDLDETKRACLTKLTLKTSFQLLADFGGGANLAFVPIIIVPVSGINLSYNPAFTHSVQITLALAKNNNKALCKSSPQPNTVNR